MTRLLLLNGLPGSGKSTVAARYAADRPLALVLDVDVVRSLLGGWRAAPVEAGLAARRLASAMASAHLARGRDVVVPQYVAVPDFVDALSGVAARAGAGFAHVLLRVDPGVAWTRIGSRGESPQLREPLDANGFAALVARLDAFTGSRSELVNLDAAGGPEDVHRRLVDTLASPDTPEG